MIGVSVTVGLTSCGATTPTVIVARVGSERITNHALEEWIQILAPDHFVPDPPRFGSCIAREEKQGQQSIGDVLREQCAAQYAALKTAALRFLITSDWLIGEARRIGRTPSDRAVENWLASSHVDAASSHQARHLLAERTLSARAVAFEIHAQEPQVSSSEVSGYYERHLASFERPEQRFFDIAEDIPTEAEARAIRRRLDQGRHVITFTESYFKPRPGEYVRPAKRDVLKAIFAAPLGVYVGPLLLNGYYAIFRITRIVPRSVQPLTRAQGAISAHLSASQHRQALTRFLEALESRWRRLTSCRAGYTISECSSSARVRTIDPGSLGLS